MMTGGATAAGSHGQGGAAAGPVGGAEAVAEGEGADKLDTAEAERCAQEAETASHLGEKVKQEIKIL